VRRHTHFDVTNFVPNLLTLGIDEDIEETAESNMLNVGQQNRAVTTIATTLFRKD
jgi:hypothetical protein